MGIGGDDNVPLGITLYPGNRILFDGNVVEYPATGVHFVNPRVQLAIDDGRLLLISSQDPTLTGITTNDTTRTLENWEEHVVLTNSSARNVSLPADPEKGQQHTIKDGADNASIANISINGNGNTIEGASFQILDVDSGALTIFYDGTAWYFV
jgi:hypothetical protein